MLIHIVVLATFCLVVFFCTEVPSCQRCGSRLGVVARRRQNTQYHDEESNYATLCGPCQRESDEYWGERWAEYWSMVL